MLLKVIDRLIMAVNAGMSFINAQNLLEPGNGDAPALWL